MNNLKKNENGITLVALVVTIIIILILAGVALSISMEKDGLITRTKLAKEEATIAEEQEKEAMENYEREIDNNGMQIHEQNNFAEWKFVGSAEGKGNGVTLPNDFKELYVKTFCSTREYTTPIYIPRSTLSSNEFIRVRLWK